MSKDPASRPLVPATPDDLNALVGDQVVAQLRSALERAGPRQRLRITTLPDAVIERVCARLSGDQRWEVRALTPEGGSSPWRATATKIIELRNTLDVPLLVLIPPGLRSAAEDSLDIATFTELSLETLASSLGEALMLRLPPSLRIEVADALEYLRLERQWFHADQVVEYLLTTIKNGGNSYAAGGSLFVFGLLPDFQVFGRSNLRAWLSKNLRARDALSEVGQPLQSRILRLPVAPKTIQNDLFSFLRDRQSGEARAWTMVIATTEAWIHLSFDKWKLVDQPDDNDLRIVLHPLDLPMQPADEVGGMAALPLLDLDVSRALKVSFHSSPQPNQVVAWKSFRVRLLSVSGGHSSIAWESNNYAKPTGKRRTVTRSIRSTDLHGLDEGTYYIKVDAYSDDGALLTAERKIDESDPTSRAENESEYFLVVRRGAEVEPPQSRAVRTQSFTDAWGLAVSKALGERGDGEIVERASVSGTWQEAIGAAPRADAHFVLAGPGMTGLTVVVPGLVRKLELDILAKPELLGCFQVNVSPTGSLADALIITRQGAPLPDTGHTRRFVESRGRVFRAILDQPGVRSNSSDEGTSKGIVETTDLLAIRGEVTDYCQSYLELLRSCFDAPEFQQDRAVVARLAQLDAVEVEWTKSPGDPGRALLVSPTHPLRLAWHLQHAQYCSIAVQAWHDRTQASLNWRGLIDQLRRGLLPSNLPLVIYDRRGRAHIENSALTSHWSAYLPDGAGDADPIDFAATRDSLRRLLGIRGHGSGSTSVGASELAQRLLEYLQQHPYVEQLRINVFNPGDGELIADTLRELERLRLREQTPAGDSVSLRYCVQLFGSRGHLDFLGSAFESLLDPERQVSDDDEFTLTAANHLLPKLVFGRNTIEDFQRSPERFGANVSVFLEQFVPLGRMGNVERLRRGSFVGGLVQEPDTTLSATGMPFGWYKGLRPATGAKPGDLELLIREALQGTQRVQSIAATGAMSPPEIAPVVALQLDSSAQALVTEVHNASDWVLTVDRNLGLDYYDSPSSSAESAYLLDFAPEYLQEDRQRVMLTTRSTTELEALVKPALEGFGLPLVRGQEVAVVEALRSLSGRLALRILASPNHAAEVVGLLLARWLLQAAELLNDRIVIPLDAHRSWFTRDQGDGPERVVQRRADLLVVGFIPEARELDMVVVEVKMRDGLSVSGRTQLYEDMREQAAQSETRLREEFDLNLLPLARADAPLRAKELATVLTFYIKRGQRYGLIGSEEASMALAFVENLDEGFKLTVRTLGVVFERQAFGSHVDEDEPGFPVHRFGLDVARGLLERAGGQAVSDSGMTSSRPFAYDAALPDPFRDSLVPFRTAVDSRESLKSLRSRKPYARQDESLEGQRGSDQIGPVYQPLATSSSGTLSTPESVANVGRVEPPTAPAETPGPPAEEIDRREALEPGVILGANEATPQFGLIGRAGHSTVAIDLTGCNTISLFGVQGFGKSYTMGTIAEMATTPVARINSLPAPLATVIFHYNKSDAYPPEFASAVKGNSKTREVERLLAEYGASPRGIRDVVMLVPEGKLEQRTKEFPELAVQALKFSSGELGVEGWKFLLGAYGNDALYVRQLVALMRRHREGLTIEALKTEIDGLELTPSHRKLAQDRLSIAAPYIDDAASLRSLLAPGRTVIVDLRDEWVEKDEALGLFVVLLRIFATSQHKGKPFNKLVVFDEAHKYITESELIGQVVETIREMRHQATSVLIASQDPLSVPRAVIELTSVLLLHRMTSPQWIKHLRGAISALQDVSDAALAALTPGEALVWAQRATDKRFTQRPQRISIRPRFSQHGGGTRTAVDGTTVR